MANFEQFQLNASVVNPTSLQFGPDGRLYVSQVNGALKAFSIAETSTGGYTVTATETISLVAQMPNHNDNGAFNPSVTGRQVTGILVTGTAANPVLYVSSSDPRIGAGTSQNDTGLDTNSGILSRLTKSGSTWVKEDLVVGLPRSEENHAVNGMQIDPATGHLLLTVGGNTNVGAPSANFAYLPEYAYSSSIVSIDLQAVTAMPGITYRGQTYKYMLPTVNDPTRADGPNGADVIAAAQPEIFGGNDGLNQARLTADSPVQIYATGFRNIYDITFTASGKMYGIDNSGNPTWGGPPIYRQANGTFSTTPTDDVTNRVNNGSGSVNQAPLHWIEEGYYGGHPTPIRANPDGAGLYDANNNLVPLPANWPPVPLGMANPVEGYYLPPGQDRAARLPSSLETPINLRDELTTFLGSVNGIDDYRATSFDGEMTGDLVLASLNEDFIYRVDLAPNGQSALDVTNLTPNGVLGGGNALDVHAAPESGPFAGTLWVASYGGGITVLKPSDTVPPPPTDDTDGDGLNDTIDRFAVDPDNGTATLLQGDATLTWGFSQNQDHPGPEETIHNIGFTGVMTNTTTSYKQQYDPTRVVAGGAASGVLLQNITEGSAFGTKNTQLDGYQFGVKVAPDVDSFVVTTKLDNPFETTTPANYQNIGFFIGTGDQTNYLKIVAGAGDLGGSANTPMIETTFESNNQVVAQQKIPVPVFGGSLPLTSLDDITLTLTVDPDVGSVTPGWTVTRGMTSANSGTVIAASGAAVQVTGALLQALRGTFTVPTGDGTDVPSALAVGLISTSTGPGAPFDATWNSVSINSSAEPPPGEAGAARLTVTPNGALNVSTFDPNTLRLENLSSSGSNLMQVRIDLSSAILPDGIFFDPANAGGSGGKPFTIDSKIGAFNAVASYGAGSNQLGYRELTLNLTDFSPGETLGFSIDIDPDSMRGYPQSVNPGSVSGAEAAGTRVTYVFADGTEQVADLFGSGVAQAEATSRPSQAAAPTITAGGVSSGNVSVPFSDANVIVTGTPGSRVRVEVLAVEQQVVSSADPYQGNSATQVTYQTLTLDADGRAAAAVDMLPDRVMVVAAAEVNAQGIVVSAVSPELRLIQDQGTDTVPPSASGAAADLIAANQVHTVEVTYSDPSGIALASIGTSDITVTGGPNPVTVTGVTTQGSGNQVVATYTLSSGADGFTTADNGTYTVALASGAVTDTRGNATASATLDTFAVNIREAPSLTAVNTGGAVYTDTDTGIQYAADTATSPHPALTGTSTARSVSAAIANTNDDTLFQSYRTGKDFGYNVSLASGNYTIELQFVETYWTSAGKRRFDVHLEGQQVITDLDLFTAAGGTNNAYTATRNVTVTDGQLNLRLESSGTDDLDNATLSGFVVRTQSGSSDTVPPSASGAAADLIAANQVHTVEVTYSDPSGIALASIGTSDITVTGGPNPVTVTGVTTQGSGNQVVATYTLSSGADGFTTADNGTYTVALASGAVTDTRGNATASATLDTFAVNIREAPSLTAVNTGGAVYTDTDTGIQYAADTATSPHPALTGTSTARSVSAAIANTNDDTLFQSYRTGKDFGYNVSLASGNYTIELQFVETYWTSAGKRRFDVHLEGQQVITDLDLFTAAGGTNNAYTATRNVTVTDGQLNLRLESSGTDDLDNATLSGFVVRAPETSASADVWT
jgi:hypothetical protein